MVSKAELRFARWIDSLESPPTAEERQAYIDKIKADPTAVHLPGGWWFAGPLPLDELDDEGVDKYQVLHESGDYSRELRIDQMQGASTHDVALNWSKGEIRRGEAMMQRRKELMTCGD